VKIDKWQGIKHGCYNGSKVQSAVVADTVNYHWAKGTWLDKIDQYITLTPFARQKMIDSGLPSEKLTVKPNFVQSDNSKTITYSPFMLYAGRLESPKGLNDLIHLIETLPQVTFHLVGESKDSQAFAHYPNVKHFGAQPREFVLDQLANCGALLFTSICYEGMPMTILEAMSMKKPVIARNIGAMSSMIRHQENGLHYQTLEELKEHVVKLSNDLTYAKKLGEVAYEDHLTHYDANLAFDRLNTIYQTTIKNYHDEKI
jgi:glycosyltransferase involved in cell wall biosynthesis